MTEAGEQPTLLNGMPWWIKAISYVGFPIFAAAATMYILFTMLQPHVLDANQHHEATRKAMESVAYTNQVMCQNAAATKEDAEKCVPKPNH